MQVDALWSAPFIVAVVFVASALGKLADRPRAAAAFDTLDVPHSLARPWMRSAHPWAEILLALCLVVTWGLPAVLVSLVVLGLCGGYLLLVVRALQRPEPGECACFGSLGSEELSGWTIARNVWLLGLAALSVWTALDGRSPLQWALTAGTNAWWLAALGAAALMAALIVYPGTTAPSAADDVAGDARIEDYERAPTPHAPVVLGDGTVTSLRELSVARPQLLLVVSGTCSSCLPTIDAAPRWSERLPEVDVHLLYIGQDPVALGSIEPKTLYDPQRFAYEALPVQGTPSAVLLGVDGLLAGGPVAGHPAIDEFVTDVEAELAGVRPGK